MQIVLVNITHKGCMMDLLKKLGIAGENPGVWSGISDESMRAPNAKLIDSINPANGKSLAKIAMTTPAEYERVVKQAERTFTTWRQVPAPKRGEFIRKMGNALREHKDALGSLVALEMGKSKQEGDGEVQEMIDIADFAVGLSRMLYGHSMHSERPFHRMYEQWHPLGIVGVLSAFNFPVAVWAWNAFLAAVCGDVTIWKPSHKTPLCAIAVQKICNQVMQDCGCEGVFSLFITDEQALSERFVADTRIPLISFTGSSTVGRRVGAIVAERFGRSILELSGNNAIIVDETANLDLAIPAIVFGAVGTAGQRCTSTRRLFVHSSRYQEVITRLQHAYRQVTIGDPLDPHHLMGPLIDAQAKESFVATVAEAKKEGGEVLFGGHAIDRPGFYVQPTLIKAENHWLCVQKETFAPILYVMTYERFEDAIHLQNNVVQGLSSAIFTDKLQHAERFLAATGSDCGIANVNIGTSGAEIGGAFGGEKETGGGRESGSDAWKAYMRRQTNTINWGRELPLAQGIKFNLK